MSAPTTDPPKARPTTSFLARATAYIVLAFAGFAVGEYIGYMRGIKAGINASIPEMTLDGSTTERAYVSNGTH